MLSSRNPSIHGNNFKEVVSSYLEEMQHHGVIESFSKNIKYSSQFHAPFVAVLKNNIDVVIFSTTSARSDRIKEDQWDAWGIKSCSKKTTYCVLVLPDGISEKEHGFAKAEIQRIKREGYISKVDTILFLSELQKYLETFNEVK